MSVLAAPLSTKSHCHKIETHVIYTNKKLAFPYGKMKMKQPKKLKTIPPVTREPILPVKAGIKPRPHQ